MASLAAAVSLGVSTRLAPRQILISGEKGRSSGLSMTFPATLLACTYLPSPT